MSPMLVWLSAMSRCQRGVARIARCELLADRQRGAIAAECAVDLPRRGMRVGDQVVGERQLPAPFGIRGLLVDDRRQLAARLQGHLLLPRDIAELAVLVAEHQQQHRMLAAQTGRALPPGATAAAAPLPSCDRGRRRRPPPGAAAPRSAGAIRLADRRPAPRRRAGRPRSRSHPPAGLRRAGHSARPASRRRSPAPPAAAWRRRCPARCGHDGGPRSARAGAGR